MFGGIVGASSSGTIRNCFFSGSIICKVGYGGIAGYIRNTSNIDTLFVEGACDVIAGNATPENSFIDSASYRLPDFIKQYMK